MANPYTKQHKGINLTITLEDEDNRDFSVSSADVGSLSGIGQFTLLMGVADITFTRKSGQKSQDLREKVTFKKPVRFEISFSNDVVQALKAKGKALSDLELGYLLEDSKGSGSGTWVAFSDPTGVPKARTLIDERKMTGTVMLRDWLLDPPVGWGFK